MSAKAKRNIIIQICWIIGTIIGIIIFGDTKEYIISYFLLNVGYWTCYVYWRVGKKQLSTESKCNKNAVIKSVCDHEWEMIGDPDKQACRCIKCNEYNY